jgi:hypothetical protein
MKVARKKTPSKPDWKKKKFDHREHHLLGELDRS